MDNQLLIINGGITLTTLLCQHPPSLLPFFPLYIRSDGLAAGKALPLLILLHSMQYVCFQTVMMLLMVKRKKINITNTAYPICMWYIHVSQCIFRLGHIQHPVVRKSHLLNCSVAPICCSVVAYHLRRLEASKAETFIIHLRYTLFLNGLHFSHF